MNRNEATSSYLNREGSSITRPADRASRVCLSHGPESACFRPTVCACRLDRRTTRTIYQHDATTKNPLLVRFGSKKYIDSSISPDPTKWHACQAVHYTKRTKTPRQVWCCCDAATKMLHHYSSSIIISQHQHCHGICFRQGQVSCSQRNGYSSIFQYSRE
jgi:hypothetical protein